MPPSQTVSLRLKSGSFRDSHSPPLSLMKMTSVLRSSPCAAERLEHPADLAVEVFHDLDVSAARLGALSSDGCCIIELFSRTATDGVVGDWNGQCGAP